VVDEIVVPIANDHDIVMARQRGRELAGRLNFSVTDLTLIATAISEIARNITSYAGTGEVRLELVNSAGRGGIVVIATDRGPGIPDVDRAVQDGYSSGQGLGLGLPGARRLMDEFEIRSTIGVGTTVIMKKWVRDRG
jgi:serine/threonine-protein kinase RsbT